MPYTIVLDWFLRVQRLQGAGQMTGIVVAFYATLQPVREDGLVRVVTTIAPLKKGAEV